MDLISENAVPLVQFQECCIHLKKKKRTSNLSDRPINHRDTSRFCLFGQYRRRTDECPHCYDSISWGSVVFPTLTGPWPALVSGCRWAQRLSFYWARLDDPLVCLGGRWRADEQTNFKEYSLTCHSFSSVKVRRYNSQQRRKRHCWNSFCMRQSDDGDLELSVQWELHLFFYAWVYWLYSGVKTCKSNLLLMA